MQKNVTENLFLEQSLWLGQGMSTRGGDKNKKRFSLVNFTIVLFFLTVCPAGPNGMVLHPCLFQPKMCPKATKWSLKAAQEPPRGAKELQVQPKRCPRASKLGPRSAQELPNGAPEAPKSSPERPKRRPRAPKCSPRGAKKSSEDKNSQSVEISTPPRPELSF